MFYQKNYNQTRTKIYRKILRKNQTNAERRMWHYIRNKQFHGYKFYRQYSVGPYILDFYCPQLTLGIELDGGQHAEKLQEQYDIKRTAYLEKMNIRIVRFWNNNTMNNMEGVYHALGQVVEEMKSSINSPPPLSLKERE